MGKRVKPTRLRVPQQSAKWILTVRGNYLNLKSVWNWNQSPKPQRSECRTPMSRASRLRLLKEIAGIHWKTCKDYLFITLTYPDDNLDGSNATHTKQRSLFIRYVEKHVGRPVGILWRKEWEIRKSGKRQGQAALHWHLLLFGVPFIHRKLVRRWWRTILGATGPLCTHVRRADSGEHAAKYAAKYAAKKPSSYTLDNAAYLNRVFGRPWGICRQDLVARFAELHLPDLDGREVAELRKLAHELWEGVKETGEDGFTVFHDDARTLFAALQQSRLAKLRRRA